MKWIGLTGGLATGKSTVAKILKRNGFAVIDADEISKQVVSPGSEGLKELVGIFGKEILNESGSLDRKKLGRIVFGNVEQLKKLEAIIHPRVQTEVQRQKKLFFDQGHKLVFYDVPLLFEKKISGFDKIVLVYANKKIQRERLSLRDQLSEDEITARLNSQISIDDKISLSDFVIRNESNLLGLEEEVKKAINWLTGLK